MLNQIVSLKDPINISFKDKDDNEAISNTGLS